MGAAPAAEAPAANDASVLLGEWKLVGPVDDEDQTWMPEGYEAYFVFTETEMTAKVVFNGEEQTNSAEYTVEGNQLVQDASDMTWAMDGEYLILTEDGVSLRFERVSTGIVGEWNVVELIGAEGDEMAQGMEMIKALGGSIQIIFTETEMTLKMDLAGQVMEESSEYVIKGNQIINGGAALDFVLEGDRLSLTNEETAMVLVRMTEDAAEDTADATADETVEARRSDSVIGEWTLMAMTGSEDAETMWAMMEAVGATIDLTITETTATLIMEAMGTTETETVDCTVVGNQVFDESGVVLCYLEDGLLMMSEDGITMVFQVK